MRDFFVFAKEKEISIFFIQFFFLPRDARLGVPRSSSSMLPGRRRRSIRELQGGGNSARPLPEVGRGDGKRLRWALEEVGDIVRGGVTGGTDVFDVGVEQRFEGVE